MTLEELNELDFSDIGEWPLVVKALLILILCGLLSVGWYFLMVEDQYKALDRQEQQEKLDELRGDYQKAEWGSQIRSYVLHPYQMVKDHRTNHEEGNTSAVLDGDLNSFIEAYLRSDLNKVQTTADKPSI